ncbi:hypothetical protein DL96DRAFT_1605625 [Flagelloscypha sp. PMI_526]|nr:hypothetical protein DL96DRAFT_1605625 [Flagelloscypha sp. PMI_526]
MGSKPGQVPPEIWLEIAKHLSPRIIRHLASLSPTFASIAAAHKSNTIFVPTLPPILFGKGYVDMQNVACEIVQKLKRRIQSGGAVDTRHIIFYGPPRPESNESPTVFTNLSHSLGSRVRQILILLNPDLHLSSPLACQCLYFSSVWETYSANLRELSISVAVREELAVFLPSQSAALSKLEVMRLSFIDRKGLSEDPRRYLKLAVPLYTNESLQELNLHIVYPTYSTLNPSSLAEILLPKDHTLPCLAMFSIMFFPTTHPLFQLNPHSRLHQLMESYLCSVAKHSMLLEMVLLKLNLIAVWFLYKLPFPLNHFGRSPEASRRRRGNYFIASIFKTLNPPISSLTSSLANWGLKDLTIVSNLAQGTSTVVIPNYGLMRDMAGFIPSIESFNGRGDMLECLALERNAYIDRIWNDNAHN